MSVDRSWFSPTTAAVFGLVVPARISQLSDLLELGSRSISDLLSQDTSGKSHRQSGLPEKRRGRCLPSMHVAYAIILVIRKFNIDTAGPKLVLEGD